MFEPVFTRVTVYTRTRLLLADPCPAGVVTHTSLIVDKAGAVFVMVVVPPTVATDIPVPPAKSWAEVVSPLMDKMPDPPPFAGYLIYIFLLRKKGDCVYLDGFSAAIRRHCACSANAGVDKADKWKGQLIEVQKDGGVG